MEGRVPPDPGSTTDSTYSSQKQALNALAFFFKQVLGVENPIFGVKLKKTEARIPVVLSKEETQAVFTQLEKPNEVPKKTDGRYSLPARLQYGAGLRRSELVRLRIKDIDIQRKTVTVRSGKGDKDRVTMLPNTLWQEVVGQIEKARTVWQKDCLGRLLRLPLPSGSPAGWLSHA